jgi:glutathione synthase/RimK-type ligase-like ATP-grasp enzyme
MSVSLVALATATDAWQVDEDAPLLVAALEVEGISAVPAVWDDPGVDWSSFDLVVLRSTWDYTDRLGEFLAWIDRIATVTTVANPPATIRWNTDKHYLDDLARRGVAVVPTSFVDAGAIPVGAEIRATLTAVLDDAAAERRELVVKPTVSAGSKDTARYDERQLDGAAAHALRLLEDGRDVMVQPYLSSVDVAGETGMVLLDGVYSHAFRKGALLRDGAADVDGLFAVEEISATTPAGDELELARAVLHAATEALGGIAPRYARVDVLRGHDGTPVLLELELTEPSFFLWTAPDAPARVARAIGGWA